MSTPEDEILNALEDYDAAVAQADEVAGQLKESRQELEDAKSLLVEQVLTQQRVSLIPKPDSIHNASVLCGNRIVRVSRQKLFGGGGIEDRVNVDETIDQVEK